MIRIIKGDLIKLAKEREFDVICHGSNCFLKMGAGIAKQIKNEFPQAYEADCKTKKGDISKLGKFSEAYIEEYNLIIINAYVQYNYSRFKNCTDYLKLYECFKSINRKYNDKKIGIPMIGAGLGGGDWNTIYKIIDNISFKNLTVVKL